MEDTAFGAGVFLSVGRFAHEGSFVRGRWPPGQVLWPVDELGYGLRF